MKNVTKGGFLGKNIHARIKGNHLLIRVDLTKNYGASSTGKTNIVATTRGCVRVPGRDTLRYGVNVFEALPKQAA
jgi:hypothetical protein